METRWSFADVGAILACRQKDEFYCHRIEEQLRTIAIEWGLPPAWTYRLDWIRLARLLYYGFTLLPGNSPQIGRTLGEEYAHLLPVDVRSQTSLQIHQRILLVLSNLVIPPAWMEDLLMPLHLALFYWTGRYAEWSRRILGLRYIKYPRETPLPPTDWICQTTSVVTLLVTLHRLFLRCQQLMKAYKPKQLATLISSRHLWLPRMLWSAPLQMTEESKDENSPVPTNTNICRLCLESRKNTTVTRCGHLFCWQCILAWLQTRPQCPLCRQECLPAHLFCIMMD